MFTRILSFISACVAAIAIYEIIVNDGKLYILAGIALFFLLATQIIIFANKSEKKALKHLETCTDENCETRRIFEEAGLETPPIKSNAMKKEDTTYRIREQKLFEKFGEVPEYGEYDMEFFNNGLEKDVASGFIKTFTQPNSEEMKSLIQDAKDYRDRNDTRWYHARVLLKKQGENFLSRDSKETKDANSETFKNYQNLVSELIQVNTNDSNNDSIGGINVVYM